MHDKMARNTVVEENEGASDLSMSESDDDSEMQVIGQLSPLIR